MGGGGVRLVRDRIPHCMRNYKPWTDFSKLGHGAPLLYEYDGNIKRHIFGRLSFRRDLSFRRRPVETDTLPAVCTEIDSKISSGGVLYYVCSVR